MGYDVEKDFCESVWTLLEDTSRLILVNDRVTTDLAGSIFHMLLYKYTKMCCETISSSMQKGYSTMIDSKGKDWDDIPWKEYYDLYTEAEPVSCTTSLLKSKTTKESGSLSIVLNGGILNLETSSGYGSLLVNSLFSWLLEEEDTELNEHYLNILGYSYVPIKEQFSQKFLDVVVDKLLSKQNSSYLSRILESLIKCESLCESNSLDLLFGEKEVI